MDTLVWFHAKWRLMLSGILPFDEWLDEMVSWANKQEEGGLKSIARQEDTEKKAS